MYYKITNRECDVYKKLHTLRSKEIQIEQDNLQAVRNLVGDDWSTYLGHVGQQNFLRVTDYEGFAFRHPENLPAKTWKEHKEGHGVYVPDLRTKKGREMKKALNGLKYSSVVRVYEIFGLDLFGHFIFPFVEICPDETIVIYFDDKTDLCEKFTEIEEITKKVFYELMEGAVK